LALKAEGIWAAVIEVVGLGILAVTLTYCFSQKQLEQQDRLSYRREAQTRRFQATEQLADLVSRAGAHCDELIEISGPPWTDGRGLTAEEHAQIEAQRQEILQDFNAFTREWRVGAGTVGLLIKNYYAKAPATSESGAGSAQDLMESWRRLEAAVNLNLEGARSAYLGTGPTDLGELRDEMQWRLEELSRLMLQDIERSALDAERSSDVEPNS